MVVFRYGYNWKNQLTQVRYYRGGDSPAELEYSVRYGYDGEGRRIWREKLDGGDERLDFEKYAYLGDNVAADLDGDGHILAKYTTLGVDNMHSVTMGGKTYYYHTNHLGSVVAITDDAGDVVNRYEYTDSWGDFELSCPSEGKGKPCIPNRYTFTAREWDPDAQLYYYRARWYDREAKRFTGEDIIYGDGSRYSYTSNNPVTYIDRFGDEEEISYFEKAAEKVKEISEKVKKSISSTIKKAKDFPKDYDAVKQKVEKANRAEKEGKLSDKEIVKLRQDAIFELMDRSCKYTGILHFLIKNLAKHSVINKSGEIADMTCDNVAYGTDSIERYKDDRRAYEP